MKNRPVIVWFRRDLRLSDNAAVHNAIRSKQSVIFIYILDESKPRSEGRASKWWLHHSLNSLSKALERLGAKLHIYTGDTLSVLKKVILETEANAVHCNRLYEPFEISLENTFDQYCTPLDIRFKRFSGYLLFDPEAIKTKTGSPYKVFTPFWRSCVDRLLINQPIAKPRSIPNIERRAPKSCELESLDLLPKPRNWASGFEDDWVPGETGARDKLKIFLKQGIQNYKQGRDHPDEAFTSRLSPHLHFGEISPNQVLYALKNSNVGKYQEDTKHFESEIGWREFAHYLLYHFPTLPNLEFNPKFKPFPWRKNGKALLAWQKGLTGIPIVDAGMRELWHTGWMHNRVRMIVASLLTKNLGIDWRDGEAWFWDTLLDANLANNTASWQWVAGCGADATPYFRIFNPVTQAEKFDASGNYIRKWVPEIAALPNKMICAPWLCKKDVLNQAGVTLGVDYPLPVVDLKASREAALATYNALKQLT